MVHPIVEKVAKAHRQKAKELGYGGNDWDDYSEKIKKDGAAMAIAAIGALRNAFQHIPGPGDLIDSLTFNRLIDIIEKHIVIDK